jgi:hypothetical protein
MILSAYSVETESKGFAVSSWPAVSIKSALRLARKLSQKLVDDPRYPNSFWVVGSRGKPICKFYRGERFERSQVV